MEIITNSTLINHKLPTLTYLAILAPAIPETIPKTEKPNSRTQNLIPKEPTEETLHGEQKSIRYKNRSQIDSLTIIVGRKKCLP